MSTYQAMLGDAMVQTAMTIKRKAVLAAEHRVTDDGTAEGRRRADFVRTMFEQMDGSPLSILDNAMQAFVNGWSVQELVYALDGRHIVLKAVRSKDPENFGLEVDAFGAVTGLVLRTPGEPVRHLDTEKFVVFTNRPTYADPRGTSDLGAAYRHWRAKQDLLSAWKLHLSRFAMPTVLGKYQRGLPREEQEAVAEALRNLQDNVSVVFPSEIDISTLGGDPSASTGFQEAVEFHNREIARAILGQTLTTDEGRRVGSLALGKVHLQVLLLQTEALRKELADRVMTEQVVRPLVELNFGPGPVPRFEFDRSSQDAFATGRLV
ncbi:MAG: DUF935 family protein [Fimbriimonadaceae bacterium]|nr:DUF935 family protein [Fimbriimonadaceae bacterium]